MIFAIRIARQRLGMDGELAALAALEGGGDADLDAELVGLVRLALADAFSLGGVPAVDLGPRWPRSCASTRCARISSFANFDSSHGLCSIFDFADDIANDAAEIGLELAQRAIGTLELAGMGIALVHDERELADPLVGLSA
jgi:hypothetical protein